MLVKCCEEIQPHEWKPPVEREEHRLPFWLKVFPAALHPGLGGELLFGSFLVGFTWVLCGFPWRHRDHACESVSQGGLCPRKQLDSEAIKSSPVDHPLLHREVPFPQNLVFTKATFIKQFSLVFFKISECPKGFAGQLMNLKYCQVICSRMK